MDFTHTEFSCLKRLTLNRKLQSGTTGDDKQGAKWEFYFIMLNNPLRVDGCE